MYNKEDSYMVNMVKKIGYAVCFMFVRVVGCEIPVCIVKGDGYGIEDGRDIERRVRGSSVSVVVVCVDRRRLGKCSVNCIGRGDIMGMSLWNKIKWYAYRWSRMSLKSMEFWLRIFDSEEIDSDSEGYMNYYLDAIDENALPWWDVIGLIRDYIFYIKTENDVNPGYVHNAEVQSVVVKENN
jgi:hypothetical protein